jgi:Na+-transporting NADH:ubiquinone oxidoreductase subunit NqrF
MCKCQILSGGGEILPTETPYFSRKEQQDNWRLGMPARDMKIVIPASVMVSKKWNVKSRQCSNLYQRISLNYLKVIF